ncbi:hypothetical protein PTKU64_86880 [Paraburkholderia terrae]|uniref:Uncharacterized protein n=1 Tax=Paraburkholderia terrae TaxID=311230 RepID=A0ABN6JVZ3_9BURK|nr:hypothetical protein PTKU64_86880 [Paraburkholderia terrae]
MRYEPVKIRHRQTTLRRDLFAFDGKKLPVPTIRANDMIDTGQKIEGTADRYCVHAHLKASGFTGSVNAMTTMKTDCPGSRAHFMII